MGTAQSGPKPPTERATKKTCYYELIGVERDASNENIKKAYRKKALELHPDRNFGEAETATQKFAELQSAYEILSDPHERAWYDSHRDAILGGQDITGSGAEATTFRNIRITSTEEIMRLIRKFNANISFNDDAIGFFTVVRETFEHLALEEEATAELDNLDVFDHPTFGQANDLYDEVVKPFYSAWAGFATRKTFAWKDKFRLSDAPDRRVRRLMEKENKKLRENAAREFNDAVRFLVSFVRKRDPRYTSNAQTEAQRQETSREAAAAQAVRSRTANQARTAGYTVPDWVVSREDSFDKDVSSVSEIDLEIEILECVVCDKTFKSEKQLEAHERSRKHLKSLQKLQWKMRKEGVDLQLGEGLEDWADELQARHDIEKSSDNNVLGEVRLSPQMPEGTGSEPVPLVCSVRTVGDKDYTPMSVIEDPVTSSTHDENQKWSGSSERRADNISASVSFSSASSEANVSRKMGKAKSKRARKAVSAAYNAVDDKHRCRVCAQEFDTRTKLFAHIRIEGHAVATRSNHDSVVGN